jgi:hypothetical protein
MSETATTARYELLDSKDHAPTDEEEGEEEDDSNETSLTAISWILGIHFFASALTVTALPSLLIEILNGIVTFFTFLTVIFPHVCLDENRTKIYLSIACPLIASYMEWGSFFYLGDHADAAKWNGWLNGGRALLNLLFIPFLGAISDVLGRKVRRET